MTTLADYRILFGRLYDQYPDLVRYDYFNETDITKLRVEYEIRRNYVDRDNNILRDCLIMFNETGLLDSFIATISISSLPDQIPVGSFQEIPAFDILAFDGTSQLQRTVMITVGNILLEVCDQMRADGYQKISEIPDPSCYNKLLRTLMKKKLLDIIK